MLKYDPIWIQAIAAIISSGITIWYVILTSKLVHFPHTAFLQPDGIHLSFDHSSIKIKNFGPGTAVCVKIFVRVTVPLELLPTTEYPPRLFMAINWEEAKGASTIADGSTEFYQFEGMLGNFAPIKVKWKLVTGKKRQDIWFYKTDTNIMFLTNENVNLSYYWHRIVESIKSPYFKLLRKYYQRKRSLQRK